MASEHHFPRFHVRPPSGYVNDPNGPIRIGERWHLYFQYVADTERRGGVVWGHASSPDLARWTMHRPALSPDPDGADRDGCWSGTTVLDGDEVVALYSGFRHEHPYQSVLAARSVDGGHSFGPPQQVADDPAPQDGVDQFRDPFVWKDGDGWLMVAGAGNRSGRPAARLYSSPDLQTWTFEGHYAELIRADVSAEDVGDMWECPQVVSFGDRDALLVSTMDLHGGGIGKVLALTGRRDGLRQRDPRVSRADFGPNFYAASALRDGTRPIVWGWVTEGRSGESAVAANWSGLLSLPRAVSLAEDGRLASAPLDALQDLRVEPIAATAGAGTTMVDDLPAQFEADLDLHGSSGETRLSLRCGEEHLDIVLDWTAGTITIDRDHASLDPSAEEGGYPFEEPALRERGSVSLRWYVDGSVSELFTGSGRCATARFYPTTPPPWRLQITGSTGSDTIRVWRLADRHESDRHSDESRGGVRTG